LPKKILGDLDKYGTGAPIIQGPTVGNFRKLADIPELKRTHPKWYSPLLSFINYYLPFDRATMYQYLRYFDTFHPMFGNAIDIHTQLPLSRFALKGISDNKVLQFYEDTMEEMDAFTIMYGQMREYWLVAESFVYLYWDDNLNTFTDGVSLMPEFLEIVGHPIVGEGDKSFIYKLMPDPTIVDFLASQDPETEKIKKKIPKDILKAITSQKNIILNPFNLMIMMRRQSPYNIRGTAIGLRVLQDLIYESKLRESQMAIAERFISPKELWKVGDVNWQPSQDYLTAFAEMIKDAATETTFQLVTHHSVTLEFIGAVGKFPNLANEFDFIEKRVMHGLFTNAAITTGEGPNFATASIGARTLLMRYIPVRNLLERKWENGVFLPISVANEFYEPRQADLDHNVRTRTSEEDKVPILPVFDWRYKTNLLDDNNFRELIVRMQQQGQLPMKMVADVLNMDYKEMKHWLKKEEGGVFDELYKEWRKALILAKKGKGASIDIDKFPIPRDLEFSKAKSKGEEYEPDEKELTFLRRGYLKTKIKAIKELIENKDQINKAIFTPVLDSQKQIKFQIKNMLMEINKEKKKGEKKK